MWGAAAGFTVNSATLNLVDGDRPSVSSVQIVSTPAANGTYKAGDTVRARVTFSEAVDVTGCPSLQIQFASNFGRKNLALDTTKTQTATTMLEFAYRIRPPNIPTQGIAFYANRLTLPQGAGIEPSRTGRRTPPQSTFGTHYVLRGVDVFSRQRIKGEGA